jgi:hypothetical protein
VASEKWWAVEVNVPHVGETISYVQASSGQQAGETFPGSEVIGGPYSTEPEAEKAHPQGSNGTRASGTGPPAASDAPVQLPNPLSGIDRIGAVLEAFFKRLTDGAMWRCIGWILLGLGLIIIGIRLWAGKTPLPAPPSVVPVPV